MLEKAAKLIQLMDAVGKQVHKRVCPKDGAVMNLSLSQLRVVKAVFEAKMLAMASIAAELGITPASATNAVDRLVKDGWLIRVTDDNDRRKVVIRIAEDKVGLLETLIKEEHERLSVFLSVLTTEQQEGLISILES